jgi:hypothetical protein
VGVLDAESHEFLVYRTRDSGATWRGPTTVTDDDSTAKFKAWMAYSPKGVLGLMWRSYTEPGASGEDESSTASQSQTAPYNVLAAVSRDGGATFSTPLQITKEASPAADPKQQTGGDDFSFIALDPHSAFVAWADWTPGDMSGYFRAVDLTAFDKGGG